MLRVLSRLKYYGGMVVLDLLAVLCNVFATLMLPKYMSNIVDIGIGRGDIPYIITTGLMMVLMAFLGAVAMVGASYLSSRISMGIGRDLRRELFQKAENYSLAEFDRLGTASLITRTTNDVTQIEMLVMMTMRIVVMAPLMLIGGIVMAYASSPEMSKVIFISIPALAVSVAIIALVAMPLSKRVQKLVDRVNLVMREKLTGIRVLRAFGTEDYEEKRFDGANGDLTGNTIKMLRTMSLLMPALTIILNLTTIAVVWLGSLQVGAGILQVGDIMAMVQYVMQIMMSVTMMSMILIMMPRASVSAQRINEVLDIEAVIRDPEKPESPQDKRGYLEFRGVSFAYPDADDKALTGISFSAGPGETTAIIGSTGSGKSTLINLIPRFYDVTEGEILLDGVDIRRMTQHDLRSRLGYVPQKNMLFRESIAGNIRYGDENATDEQVAAAAAVAQASEFIETKEDVYGSQVSQGGSNLSGGQKQRLSIARAIVRRPEVYLFDDSFSALDFKTDSQLRAALGEITGDATVLLVAQRVSTIMRADRIIVLDDGQVAGIGTHEELLKNCEVYREIAISQLSAEEVGL